MSPNWFMPHKLLLKSQTSSTKSSRSMTTLISGDQSNLTLEPENDRQKFPSIPNASQNDTEGYSAKHLVSAAPRIFALVVVIDEYKSPQFENLTGSKNDGRRFINFLTGVLGVPSSQIMFLADEKAVQSEILNQFDQFLIRNIDIQRDDPMVFFFAGHGCKAHAPPGWVTDSNKIEILCPHDIQTMDDDGNELWGISDRAIDALMRRLAFEKGDNIVAVFDCCCSGGLSRSHEKGLRIRSIPPPPHPPPADLNREIWEPTPEEEGISARAAKTVIQTGFQYKAMESHVLLAACRSDESAMEYSSAKDAPGGLFTTALIEALRKYGIHDTSYARLIEMLDLKRKTQHPQCEGINKDRLLFSVNTLRNGETTFKVSNKRGKIYVSAGSIHGVVVDTEFTVTTSTQTFVLKAKKVDPFETILEGTYYDVIDASAKVSHWHHPTLRIYSSSHHSSPQVIVVPTEEQAEIALYQDQSGRWELKRFDPLISAYSNQLISFDADRGRIVDILDAIANFNSYLYRSDGAAASFAGKVNIRMNRIGLIQGEINPIGDDLLEVPRSSGVKEVIITDLDSRYSFTLENTSEVDLFPYFFYFDPSEYSIEPWYIPPSPTMQAPLEGRKDGAPSLFAFGYGGFGTNPVEFYLPPECKMDSGFLKIFLTTTYIDMSSVVQPPIHEVYSSRGLRSTLLKGRWACETVVLAVKC